MLMLQKKLAMSHLAFVFLEYFNLNGLHLKICVSFYVVLAESVCSMAQVTNRCSSAYLLRSGSDELHL